MLWALAKKVLVDTFVIYTDSETWVGSIHPVQALLDYRRKTGIPAKLVVVGMVSNGFSIADPDAMEEIRLFVKLFPKKRKPRCSQVLWSWTFPERLLDSSASTRKKKVSSW